MKVVYVILVLQSVCCVHVASDSLVSERLKALSISMKKYRRVRCTRRYSVGSCAQSVRPVWTFVAPLQSCTERLGCPPGTFANRFDSLADCLNTCRDLIYLFMYLQSGDNSSFMIPESEAYDDPRRFDDDGSMYGEYGDQERDSSDEYYQESQQKLGFRRQDLQEVLSELSGASPDHTELTARRHGGDGWMSLPTRGEQTGEPDIDHF